MAKRIMVWFWSGGGGGSQFAAHLAHRLTLQFGRDAVWLSMRSDDPTIASAEAAGVRVLSASIVSDRRKPIASFVSLAKSAEVLEQHARGADAIIIPMNFATAAPLSLALRRPLIYFAHDPEPHEGDYEVGAQRLTQAMLMRRAQTIVTLSAFGADMVTKQKELRSKHRTAPLSAVFEPKVISPPSGMAPTRMLFVGRMIAYKGVEMLAEALDHIAERTDWRLVVAGRGPALTDAAFARFSRPQVEDVRRTQLTEGEINTMMAASDVLLAPYREATQSGVISQGLSFGKPSVVTPVGALVEQIQDGRAGWIARRARASSFAHALEEMLDDTPARVAKAAAAHALAREMWEADYWSWLADV